MARPTADPAAAPPTRRPAALLEAAADAAVRAPSVHNTQPWRIALHADRLELSADHSRRLPVVDPVGRALAQSVGAALFNARVAVAAAGSAAHVERLPDPADPRLMAVLRPVDGPADPALAALAPAVRRRRTDHRLFAGDRVPEDVLRLLAAAAAAEETALVPVVHDEHVRLLGRLTQQADGIRNADPAYRAEVRRWTERDPGDGGPADTGPGTGQTLVVLATARDDPLAWLRCGEALERVLLELTAHGLVAGPLTQAVEVAVTRTQLRSALTWDAHPQTVLRIGRAPDTSGTPRHPRGTAVEGSPSPAERQVPARPDGTGRSRQGARPVSDGRGGTTWE